jgi:hypothetical protein
MNEIMSNTPEKKKTTLRYDNSFKKSISLSGNIRLVSLEKWSLMASGKLCSVTKPWNNVSA